MTALVRELRVLVYLIVPMTALVREPRVLVYLIGFPPPPSSSLDSVSGRDLEPRDCPSPRTLSSGLSHAVRSLPAQCRMRP